MWGCSEVCVHEGVRGGGIWRAGGGRAGGGGGGGGVCGGGGQRVLRGVWVTLHKKISESVCGKRGAPPPGRWAQGKGGVMEERCAAHAANDLARGVGLRGLCVCVRACGAHKRACLAAATGSGKKQRGGGNRGARGGQLAQCASVGRGDAAVCAGEGGGGGGERGGGEGGRGAQRGRYFMCARGAGAGGGAKGLMRGEKGTRKQGGRRHAPPLGVGGGGQRAAQNEQVRAGEWVGG